MIRRGPKIPSESVAEFVELKRLSDVCRPLHQATGIAWCRLKVSVEVLEMHAREKEKVNR